MGLCLPVESEAGPFGTLWAYDRRDRAPGQHEYHVLESIAAQIASVLERVVLKHESDMQHRMSRDLAVASESQSTDIVSNPAHDPRLDVAAACTSRYELGGDLCELLSLSHGRTAIAVGDASGDSVPAAMIMSAVRGALRSISLGPKHDTSQPDQVIHEVNRVLYGMTAAHQFMSLLYGVLDTASMRFTYTNAGHPPPLVGRDGRTQPLTSHGMLLGVVEKFDYTRSVVELRPGDVLVLYSDGISEAMSKGREMFRCDGIAEAVERHMAGTARDVLQAIWSKLETHTRGGESDDRTLLVIKLRN
jgi:sigma-B regulation protein RsbU (phosphoserine phosphatase)